MIVERLRLSGARRAAAAAAAQSVCSRRARPIKRAPLTSGLILLLRRRAPDNINIFERTVGASAPHKRIYYERQASDNLSLGGPHRGPRVRPKLGGNCVPSSAHPIGANRNASATTLPGSSERGLRHMMATLAPRLARVWARRHTLNPIRYFDKESIQQLPHAITRERLPGPFGAGERGGRAQTVGDNGVPARAMIGWRERGCQSQWCGCDETISSMT